MCADVRILRVMRTVGPLPDHARIILQGRWLEEAGFKEGDQIAVEIEPYHLRITPADMYDTERGQRWALNFDVLRNNPGDIVVQYKDRHKIWRFEVLSSQKEGKHYRVTSAPHRLISIAKGDLIQAEEDFGHLFFTGVVDYGPNKTIQLKISDCSNAHEELFAASMQAGCEISRRVNYRVTINMPWRTMAREDFKYIFRHLDAGVENGYWDYRSAFNDVE
jgi:hypothetical protein